MKRVKAEEVLRRYEAGERKFRLNLRGQSFKGKNLSGADFSEADIRGTNFANTCLSDAKFCRAKAGLQPHQAIVLVFVAFLLAMGAGLITGLAGFFALNLLESGNIKIFVSPITIAVIVAIGLFFSIISWGYKNAIEARGSSMSRDVTITVPTSLALGFFGVLVLGISVFLTSSADYAIIIALTVIGGVLSAVAVLLALIMAGVGAIAPLAVAVILVGLVAIAGAVVRIFVESGQLNATGAISSVVVCAVFVGLLASYIGFEALAGNNRFTWVRMIALNFAALGGTSFRRANLTKASFTRAILKSTDFRGAILHHTCFLQAQKLNQSRHENPNSSIIANPSVRYLLVHGKVPKNTETLKNPYERVNIRGAFLKGAELQGINFSGADLSGANLQDADLSRAKLIQTQLDDTDLTGATLTGATIEDWSITRSTKLQGVRCRYVFMRLPTEDDPNPRRKPDNWEEEFKDGDFADFIKPIVDTLRIFIIIKKLILVRSPFLLNS